MPIGLFPCDLPSDIKTNRVKPKHKKDVDILFNIDFTASCTQAKFGILCYVIACIYRKIMYFCDGNSEEK